jgi:hypothetical protein
VAAIPVAAMPVVVEATITMGRSLRLNIVIMMEAILVIMMDMLAKRLL